MTKRNTLSVKIAPSQWAGLLETSWKPGVIISATGAMKKKQFAPKEAGIKMRIKLKNNASKMRNKRCYFRDNTLGKIISFQSELECDRYFELKLLRDNNEIFDLELQKNFEFKVNGISICSYKADFVYFNKPACDEKRKMFIEDTKGCITNIYTIKKKLLKACFGYDIIEKRRAEVGRYPQWRI